MNNGGLKGWRTIISAALGRVLIPILVALEVIPSGSEDALVGAIEKILDGLIIIFAALKINRLVQK